MHRQVCCAAALIACILPTLPAWNETGHRLTAAIAYDNLTPQTRARVDALLKRHPDYNTLLTKNAPSDPAGRARAAFLVASYWPDIIRNDPRFYDETRANAKQTPKLKGFPSMASHPQWHYVDFNFSLDATPIPPIEFPNALEQISRLTTAVSAKDAEQAAYSLPWLIHLAGDVHNPLHTVSRYTKAFPKGDRGGNDVWVRPTRTGAPSMNLHAFWDGLGGTDPSPAYVDRYAKELLAAYTAPVPDTHPETWVVEGFYNARAVAYTFGPDNGTRENPIALTRVYEDAAQVTARERLAAAGLRLAALLNAQLK
jgi:hypothetical protein